MTRGRIAAVVLAATLVVAGAFAVGRLTAGPTPTPTPTSDSAAAGFLRDMQVHHAQAVEMALLVRDRTDDETVRTIAYDVAITQTGQAGAMYGLLDAWGLPQISTGPPMAWTELPALDGSGDGHQMDPEAPGGMPGMATQEQLAELRSATGVDAVRLYLQLMIPHHQGGLEMAEAVLARTGVPQVVTLASGIQRAQRAEIRVMEDLLAALPSD
ncbi:MAG: DUF305 domain-containing protein [Pseudolysinimonas sp.]|uniref:DUF305 domain-containing protein n=1 Tax=Pseudolysinimonas sp. TaxID=2680009 RepID=UPI003C786656